MNRTIKSLFLFGLAFLLMGAAASTSLVYVNTNTRALTGNIVVGNGVTITATGTGAITATGLPASVTLTTPVLGVATGTSLALSTLTAARVTFAGASGLLADDADLTFATDTLTGTKGTFGGIAHVANTITSANSVTAAATTDLTLAGGTSGASLVLGQGTAGITTFNAPATGYFKWNTEATTALQLIGTSTTNSFVSGNTALSVAKILTLQGSAVTFNIGGLGEAGRFAATTGNLLIGGTTDSGGERLVVTRTVAAAALSIAPVVRLANATGEGTFNTLHFAGALSDGYLGFLDSATAATRRVAIGANSLETLSVNGAGNVLIGTTTDISGTGGLKVAGTTASTTTTSGAFQVAGGAGIVGAAWVGGLLNVAGTGTFGGAVTVSAGLTYPVAQTMSVTSGTNQRAGNTTLVGGTKTVANTTVTANTIVMATRKTTGGTVGTSVNYSVSAGTSFTISTDNILDTSTFSYFLIEVP